MKAESAVIYEVRLDENYHSQRGHHVFYAQDLYRVMSIDELREQIERPQLSDDDLYPTNKGTLYQVLNHQ
jgi:glutathione synthase/RimK-type ligase-like ATP-grasp enzyme